MNDFPELAKDWGWIVLLILWIVPRAFTFITERYFPTHIAAKQQELDLREEGVRAEREARATMLRAQIDREERESERRLKLEERMVTSLEQMSLGISVGNERIAAMIASQTTHHNFVFGSTVELKEKLESLTELVSARRRIADLKDALKETQEKIKLEGLDGNEETNEAG